MHNVTEGFDSSVKYLFQREVESSSSKTFRSPLQVSSARQFGETYIAVADGNVVTAMRSLLPYQTVSNDISWIRTPIIVGVIVLVIIYQFVFKRRTGLGTPNKFDSSEIEKIMKGMGSERGRFRQGGESGGFRRGGLGDGGFGRGGFGSRRFGGRR